MLPSMQVSPYSQINKELPRPDVNDWHSFDDTGQTPLFIRRTRAVTGSDINGNHNSLSRNPDAELADIQKLLGYSRLTDHKTLMGSGPYKFTAVWWNDTTSTHYVQWQQNQSPLDLAALTSSTGIVKLFDSTGLNFAEASEVDPADDDFFGVRVEVDGRWNIIGPSLSYDGVDGTSSSGDASRYQAGYAISDHPFSFMLSRQFQSRPWFYLNFALYGY